MVLAAGRCVAAGPAETTLTASTLSAAYGLPLRLDASGGRYHARRDG
jgi:iron complex transport system ATP-binding protein